MKQSTNNTRLGTGLIASALLFGSAAAWSEQDAKKSTELGKQKVEATGVPQQTSNMILVGELVETRDVKLKDSKLGSHRLLKVKPSGAQGPESAKGPESVIVDIGRQDAASTFGLMKGDRVIAVGKAGRINDRPVLFAKSIGELYPVGDVGSVASQPSQIRQDNSARGATAAVGAKTSSANSANASITGRTRPAPDPVKTGQAAKPDANDGMSSTNPDGAAAMTGRSQPGVDVPETRTGNDIVLWFESDNLGTDQYGSFDRDFVWFTDDPWYPAGNPADTVTWNDNWEKPHWDVWGYDDADEWGIWDW
jgi:hypothetical protein